jgi:uncharacterized protein YciI
MQFLVLAHDGDDSDALARRLAVREAHLALGNKLRDEGKMLYGAAILDETSKMVGSVLICDFASRQDLDHWLEEEPYVTGQVWKNIEVRECRVGPTFEGKIPGKTQITG